MSEEEVVKETLAQLLFFLFTSFDPFFWFTGSVSSKAMSTATIKLNWYKLDYIIKEKILNYLGDEEKVDLIVTFPMVITLIKSFVFDFDNETMAPTQERLGIFEKCTKVTKLILRMKPPFDNEFGYVSLIKSVAAINPNLTSIDFEVASMKGPSTVAINCYDSKLMYLRLDYIESILSDDPFYDGKQFTDPVMLCTRTREVESMYQNLKMDKRIIYLRNENYDEFSDELLKSVTEIDMGSSYGTTDLMTLIHRCPRLKKVELLLSDSIEDYKSLFDIVTLKSVTAWTSKNFNNIMERLLNCNISKLDELTILGTRSKRVLQLKHNLLIFTSRVKLPTSQMIRKFEKVNQVIFEECNEKQLTNCNEIKNEIDRAAIDGNRCIEFKIVKESAI